MDLQTVIDRCIKNDRQAQTSLYNFLAPQLLGVCRRYMRDTAEAEDVMQDAFVKIFTSLKTFKNQGSFEGWAKRIAANRALDVLKKKNRISFERNLELAEIIEFTEEEEQQLDPKEILACMDLLPVGYRTIINLYLVEEFSHREIADKLNISESTSRSQCARARQALLKGIKEKMHLDTARKAH